MYHHAMLVSDLQLSRRLERAEGYACVQFAETRRHLFPESGAEWIQCAGAYAVFDGIDSPVTQTFGLGIFEELTAASLDMIERFFIDRGAPVLHEVSPMAGVAALDLLCSRSYRPIEISSVLYRPVERPVHQDPNPIKVRIISPEEVQLWADINARGWTSGHPELTDFSQRFGKISAACRQSFCFLAEIEGKPGAAGILYMHDGVALLSGASTVPEMRHRGMQSALLQARLSFAFDHGCDLASMAAEVGSESQRNAERKGFRIAYTRTKWHLTSQSQRHSEGSIPCK